MKIKDLFTYLYVDTASENSSEKLIKSTFLAVMCVFISLLFTSCNINTLKNLTGSTKEIICTEKEKPEKKLIAEKKEPITIQLGFVGDVMCHDVQLNAQKQKDGTYDFSNNYQYIKKYVEDMDIAVCNVETTFPEDTIYLGYPLFRTPERLAEDLKNVGFDVAITANNHMMDSGHRGVLNTVNVLKKNQLNPAGSKLSEDQEAFTLVEVKGIKIGIVPYTYETTGVGSQNITINSIPVPAETKNLINTFSFWNIEEDFKKIKKDCEKVKRLGADILVVYYHWGNEYQTVANRWQQELAKKTVEETEVDLIIGSHPHVLQQVEFITKIEKNENKYKENQLAKGEENQEFKYGENEQVKENQVIIKEVPVFYSLGNLISNQRYETFQDKNTEVGVMAVVDFKVDIQEIENKKEKKVTLKKVDALPLWVSRYRDGKWVYEIIPLDENIEKNETLIKTNKINRAKEAKEEAYEILRLDR